MSGHTSTHWAGPHRRQQLMETRPPKVEDPHEVVPDDDEREAMARAPHPEGAAIQWHTAFGAADLRAHLIERGKLTPGPGFYEAQTDVRVIRRPPRRGRERR